MSVNITEVRLLSVPLEKDYKHTYWFGKGKHDEQAEFFKGKTISGGTLTNYSYQRKDNTIRVDKHIDELWGKCNYVMYRNKYYSNKWFYAFITDMEYRNDETTIIHIETDVMQTWMCDMEVRKSFVEREHVNDDTIGKHTVPEQLETGEYIVYNQYDDDITNEYLIILGTTWDLEELKKDDLTPAKGELYNGIYSGVKYYAFGYDVTTEEINQFGSNIFAEPYQLVSNTLAKLADNGGSDGVVSLFYAPKKFVELGSLISVGGSTDIGFGPAYCKPVKKSYWESFRTWDEVKKPKSTDDYKPNNNKLFTYPYRYLLMSNNAGSSAVYHYEYFDDDTDVTFGIGCAITPGGSTRLIPQNYKGAPLNFEEGLTAGKLPICAWSNDVYTNWLTQNSVNIGVGTAMGLVQVAAGTAMTLTGAGAGFGAGLIASGVSSIGSTVGEVYQHSKQAPQAEGNINSGDVTFAMGELRFRAYDMGVKPEFLKIIDGYFDRFGYKVNEFKVPNVNHREAYWFTKTIDPEIDGAIPNVDLQKIKVCYTNGITFWKPAYTAGNYSVTNNIV